MTDIPDGAATPEPLDRPITTEVADVTISNVVFGTEPPAALEAVLDEFAAEHGIRRMGFPNRFAKESIYDALTRSQLLDIMNRARQVGRDEQREISAQIVEGRITTCDQGCCYATNTALGVIAAAIRQGGKR